PGHCVTMVAVPALLLNEQQVGKLVEDLEIRYLGNRDRNIHFALLTDLPDSRETALEHDPRVTLCAELIRKLNEKYASQESGSFFLLHRHRVYNEREGQQLGSADEPEIGIGSQPALQALKRRRRKAGTLLQQFATAAHQV